ncbi:MAG: hypothetical protein AABZ74_02250 [Cyanobacteriota bacterium]
MIEKYLPKDILISFSEADIFRIENITRELEISLRDFCDFIVVFLQENYLDQKIDLLLMFYEYILQRIPFEIDELTENDIFINSDLNYENIFLDEVVVKNSNKNIMYFLKKETILKITKIINQIPENEKTKTIKWFVNEIKRCNQILN